jgi:branched-chain amino acid transport system substrate-binding protein
VVEQSEALLIWVLAECGITISAFAGSSVGAVIAVFAALGYDCIYMLRDALESANTTDIAKVRDAFNATNGSYVTGNLTFDEKRNPIKSAVMMEIVKQDGKLTPVYKATVNP